ncbi:MAG: hypothetical protein JRD19_01975 [Deltaproteobacteria bacterium]|jgi:hypothetical protein|nr:hypothetical protein [Deltaproteobacteria bacterium]
MGKYLLNLSATLNRNPLKMRLFGEKGVAVKFPDLKRLGIPNGFCQNRFPSTKKHDSLQLSTILKTVHNTLASETSYVKRWRNL